MVLSSPQSFWALGQASSPGVKKNWTRTRPDPTSELGPTSPYGKAAKLEFPGTMLQQKCPAEVTVKHAIPQVLDTQLTETVEVLFTSRAEWLTVVGWHLALIERLAILFSPKAIRTRLPKAVSEPPRGPLPLQPSRAGAPQFCLGSDNQICSHG